MDQPMCAPFVPNPLLAQWKCAMQTRLYRKQYSTSMVSVQYKYGVHVTPQLVVPTPECTTQSGSKRHTQGMHHRESWETKHIEGVFSEKRHGLCLEVSPPSTSWPRWRERESALTVSTILGGKVTMRRLF